MDQFEKEEDRKLPPSDKKINKTDSIINKKEKAVPVKKSSSKKNKKKSQQADDGAPVRPLSGYNYFFRDERARMLKARQEGNAGDIGSTRAAELFSAMGKTIAKRWRELPDKERAVYMAIADKDSKRYQIEKKQYQTKLSQMDKKQRAEKKKQQQSSRPPVQGAVKPKKKAPSKSSIPAAKSPNTGIPDNSKDSQVAAIPTDDRTELARLQMQNSSTNLSHLTAGQGEPTCQGGEPTSNNLALLRAALMAQEQNRIDELLRAQQIQSIMGVGGGNFPLDGLSQSHQQLQNNPNNGSAQDLYLASLSNSLGRDFGTELNYNDPSTRNIQEAIMQQERFNSFNNAQQQQQQQSYDSQLAFATQQQLRHQQLLMQNSFGQQPVGAANDMDFNNPFISQLLSQQQQQSQGNFYDSFRTSNEGIDESSSNRGQFPDYDRY